MSDLISRQALLDLCHNHIDGKVDANDIARMPSAEKTDTVSLEAYKQVIGERDIAIQQLKELGYEFGEKIEQEPTDKSNLEKICEELAAENDDLRDQLAMRDRFKQEPKTGHWIMSDDGLYRPICDKCGAHPWKGYIPTVEEATEVFKFCPNCGCRMVEPQKREET